ncbi:putative lipase [Corynespora cassiicola Philippines]|uniref:Carboxylic ester hydrolase n=1 Tax=Corynespora cassiicola Philippines TaxID=1448308 RepID=A0A2T2P8X2_CORCC|nr:putative lipase [Corynespora cassiicola Philippines]
MKWLLLAILAPVGGAATLHVEQDGIKYLGFDRNGLDVFSGIPYAQDTGGCNRFKPPRPVVHEPGTTIDATRPGIACPQQYGQWYAPLTLANITAFSEDCLNLNIVRPANPSSLLGVPLPVLVWIHGGSFWVGSNNEPTHVPDGLVLKSIKDGAPIIHVAINYRLGFFGFAQSESLKEEGSGNAGLRDQRLAIEWVRDHIAAFGGNPDKITIHGQSSGGLAVGLQLLAYGGTKPLPYQRGICQSQALEPGITGNFTKNAMTSLVDHVGCNTTSLHSPETIACLRNLDTYTLMNASLATYTGDIDHNIGDIWLPTVDGDFLPAPPSQLIDEGRFGNATYMFGWADGDLNFYTDVSIETDADTNRFIASYLPRLPGFVRESLLAMYPVQDFEPPPGTNLTAEFYRAARVFRDILMVCEPVYLAEAMHKRNNHVYMYDFNQTMLDPILESLYNISHLGVVHTSEFAYIFGNLSHYNVSGYPFNPTRPDYDLAGRAPSWWIDFVWFASPSEYGIDSWRESFFSNTHEYSAPRAGYTYAMVIGGSREGYTAFDGPDSTEEMRVQQLRERCAFINSADFIKYAGF